MTVHPAPLSDAAVIGAVDRAIIGLGHADVTEHPRESDINAQLPVDKSGLRKLGFGAAAGPAAGRQEYLIEAMDDAERWYILGADRLSSDAQRHMADYRRTFPKLPLRVREYPSRRLIVLNDPRASAA